MAELRWVLIIAGLVLLAGVYLYTRWGARLSLHHNIPLRRQEPVIGANADDANADDESIEESVAEEPPAPTLTVQPDAKVIAVRVMCPNRAGFDGEGLVLALREAGLQHGEFGIFHRRLDDGDRQTQFSVANLSEPGSFDLTRIKIDHFAGVSLFMVLPGPDDPVNAFDLMLDTARQLVRKLGADLLDEQGSTLSIQRERYLREEVIQFEHQRSTVYESMTA